MGFPIALPIRQGNDHNYMLCIIASDCFFSGASVHGGGGWNAQCLFALVGGLKQWFCKNNTVIEGLIAKSVTKKTTAGLIVRKPAKRLCKP